MAHYLLKLGDTDEDGYHTGILLEAGSSKEAVAQLGMEKGVAEVWTLRSKEPRTFEVSTESVRTITQT